ncbi:MAG: DUF2851 family protein [Bacteroidota bacterium]
MRGRSKNIHERFLRHIWSRQYLDRNALRTTDGQTVRVLHVGTLNLESGPDFLNARIRIGDTIFVGDVEIHRTSVEWLQHQHHTDPQYNRVILHVVLEGDEQTTVQSGRHIPVLILGHHLPESIRRIWHKTILDERARVVESIPCFKVNDAVPRDVLLSWLRRLSVERMELKLRLFEERLRELAYRHLMSIRETPRTWGDPPEEGDPDDIPPPLPELTQQNLRRKSLWEQVLYEGMMDGLGYSKNREPFVKLARSATLDVFRPYVNRNLVTVEALLYGVAGLLPFEGLLQEEESRRYAGHLTRAWKELLGSFTGEILAATDWRFFPTRPTNFPTVRIAAAASLIQKILSEDLFRKIIQALKSGLPARERRRALLDLLDVEPAGLWSRHYHFDRPTTKTITMLGAERRSDIITNTILPIAFLYARIFKDREVRQGALQIYSSFPPAEENFITRLMYKQLLKGTILLDSVSKQQGVIQLYKFYCTQHRCSECSIGTMVFGREGPQPHA